MQQIKTKNLGNRVMRPHSVGCVLSWTEKGNIIGQSLTVQVLILFSDCVSDGATAVLARQAGLESGNVGIQRE